MREVAPRGTGGVRVHSVIGNSVFTTEEKRTQNTLILDSFLETGVPVDTKTRMDIRRLSKSAFKKPFVGGYENQPNDQDSLLDTSLSLAFLRSHTTSSTNAQTARFLNLLYSYCSRPVRCPRSAEVFSAAP